jgi:hypothetical protein
LTQIEESFVYDPDTEKAHPITGPGAPGGAQQYPQAPLDKKKAVKGQIYQTNSGPATWDGTAFVL